MTGPTKIPVSAIMSALIEQGVPKDHIIVLAGAADRAARNFVANGFDRGVQCQINHHTASSGLNPAGDVNYMTFGKGAGFVTANEYDDIYGRIWLLACAGGTYTNGIGGPLGPIPSGGANRRGWGREVGNDGTGIRPYTPEQQDAVAASNVGLGLLFADMYDWEDDPFSQGRNFSHFEWAPGRKFDPAGESRWQDGTGTKFYNTRLWNMDAFRAELRSAAIPELPTDPQEYPMRYIAQPPISLLGQYSPWLIVIDGSARYATSADLDDTYGDVPPIYQFPDTEQGRDQYRFLKAQVFGLPINGLTAT